MVSILSLESADGGKTEGSSGQKAQSLAEHSM